MIPTRLKKGDTIGVIAPSYPITSNRVQALERGIQKLNQLGFKVKLGKNVMKNTLGYSATKEEKAEDFNEMIRNKEIKAIFSAKGGENSFTCLSLLDYEAIKNNAKIIYGISDATTYLEAIYQKTGLITFHQSDVKTIGMRKEDRWELDDLVNRLVEAKWGEIDQHSPWECWQKGEAEGILLGGNIQAILNLMHTEYCPDFTNKILFLEAYDQSTTLDKLDCYLSLLDYHHVFNQIKGLWIGHYKGKDQQEAFQHCFLRYIEKYSIPTIHCDDFGHNCENVLIPIGAQVHLDATHLSLTLQEPIVK